MERWWRLKTGLLVCERLLGTPHLHKCLRTTWRGLSSLTASLWPCDDFSPHPHFKRSSSWPQVAKKTHTTPAWVSLQLLPYAAPARAHSNCLGNPVGLRQLRAISSSQIPACVLPCRCLRCSETSWRRWRWCLVGCCHRPGCLRLRLPPWANTEYNNFSFVPCAHIVLKDRQGLCPQCPCWRPCCFHMWGRIILISHTTLIGVDQSCHLTDFNNQNLMD